VRRLAPSARSATVKAAAASVASLVILSGCTAWLHMKKGRVALITGDSICVDPATMKGDAPVCAGLGGADVHVVGIKMGDCVTWTAYAESARLHSIRRVPC